MNILAEVQFTGDGCAICMASSSLMTERLRGLTIDAARSLFDCFHQVLVDSTATESEELGKLAALKGVSRFPMRVKCATLPWHTLFAALSGDNETVSTE